MARGSTRRHGEPARLDRSLGAACAALLIASSLLASAAGCASLEHALDPDTELEVYGGTSRSWDYVTDGASPAFGTLCRVIDLPLTVIMDTLLLPVSLTSGSE